MKLFKKILAFLLVITFLLFLILEFAVPPLAASYVQKHSKEWIGRKVTVDSFSWNLLSLKISLQNVSVFESDDSTEFIGFDNLYIDLNPLALITGCAELESFTLHQLRARVIQNGERFNFSEILDFLNAKSDTLDTLATSTDSLQIINENLSPKDTTPNPTVSSVTPVYSNPIPELPLRIKLKNINISGVNISYRDVVKNMELKIKDAAVSIPQVHLDSNFTAIHTQAQFEKGGNVQTDVNFAIASGAFDVQLKLEQFALQNGFSIAQSIVNIDSLIGDLNVQIAAKGSLQNPLATPISGSVSLQDFSVRESAGGAYRVDDFKLAFTNVNLEKNEIPVDSIFVSGVHAHFDRFKNGSNVDKLLKKETNVPTDSTASDKTETTKNVIVQKTPQSISNESADTTAKEISQNSKQQTLQSSQALPNVTIKKLLLEKINFTLNDYSITKPLHYSVKNIQVRGENLTADKLPISVSMQFQESGSLSVQFLGSLNDLTTMQISLDVEKMALRPLSPYSVHYTGYPLISGKVYVKSRVQIQKNNLKSTTAVRIDKIDVADKEKGVDPEFSIPMKVGLYILKDRKDQIQMDLPVSGNLQDPEFSFGKVIWQTFCNLIVKVALTPTKLITAPIDALTDSDDDTESKSKSDSTTSSANLPTAAPKANPTTAKSPTPSSATATP